MNRKNKFALTSAFTSLLVTTLAPLTTSAAPSLDNVGINIATPQVSAAANYWTLQRMQEAKPLDVISTNSPKQVTQTQLPSGPLISAPSSGPSSANLEILSQQLSTSTQVTGSTALGFPFTRSFVNLSRYTKFPEATVGKIFFTQNGGNFVCSGSAVTSTNKRLIWTAGHCVSDGKRHFATNVIFIPGYKPGTAVPEPLGRWSACGLYTTSAWHNNGDLARDLGAIKACDKSGKRLHNVVGALGFLANASRNQFFNAFGYPAAAPFDGRRMVKCAAPFGGNASGNPQPLGIGCNMTGGSSGGPWMVRYSPNRAGAVNQINGFNSFKISNQPNIMYSPYFDSTFLGLRTYAIQNGS